MSLRWFVQASGIGLMVLLPLCAPAQPSTNERTFPQSKAAVEKALKALQGSMAGKLPVLDGFAQPGDRPLDRYQRGYYQATAVVTQGTSGTIVRITTKVTAWYNDPGTSGAGYQLLKSNGRIESDLFDQLSEQLAKGSAGTGGSNSVSADSTSGVRTNTAEENTASKFPANGRTFSSTLKDSVPVRDRDTNTPAASADKSSLQLQQQLASLQDVLKNMGHPKNLVAVKKSGTAVVDKPSLTAKPQFLASAHDEFELLDFNADWVHVRISGLSRGWIWRNSVEMPEGIPETAANPASALSPAADMFRVSREETAPFPGDWQPLRNRHVKIFSVQKIDEAAKDAGPKERLEYAKYLFDKNYAEMTRAGETTEGIVVIFDSADGGMIASTRDTLEQWKTGKLSDAALWHKCFFDPPETFDANGGTGTQ